MRIVFRSLFLAALVLSTCAMRASYAHAQEPPPEQEQRVLALIGAPEVPLTFERAGRGFRRP